MSDDDRAAWVRVGAVALLAVVPWTVILYAGEADFVFSWGLANTNPPSAVHLYDYLFEFTRGPRSLPDRLLVWPLGTLVYLGALASATAGAQFGREDPRVTAALLGAVAVANLRFTVGIGSRTSTAVPVGAAAVAVVLWWFYLPLVRGDAE